MKKYLLLLSVLSALTSVAIFLFTGSSVSAAFNANSIMSDAAFNNSTSLTASEIDTWINNKYGSTSCISTLHGFKAPEPVGFSPTGGFSYGSDATAGTIIYDAAHVYGLNPKVIMATIEKEESLVSGSAGCTTLRYTSAMGYSCTDGGSTNGNYSGFELYSINGTAVTSVSGSCVSAAKYAGFSRQVIYATWQLEFGMQRSEGNVNWDVQMSNFPHSGDSWNNSDDPTECYYNFGGYMTPGNRAEGGTGSGCTTVLSFSGKYTIDSTAVTMETGATASLYDYTPHISGNQSFYNIFVGWFGNITDPYYYLSSSIPPPTQLEYGQVSSTVEFKIVNNSSATWYSDGHTPAGVHPYRLMTLGYTNTPFANTSDSAWLGTQNQVRMVESSVATGGTATFDFTLKAPQYSMSTNICFELVQDGVQVHGDQVLCAPTTSLPDYGYQVVSINAPRGILPGDAYLLSVQLKNTGVETWYSDGHTPAGVHPIRLATSGYANTPYAHPALEPAWLGTQNQIKLSNTSVPRGSIGTFSAVIFAPYAAENFTHNFRLVLDGVKFIGGTGMPVPIYTPSPIGTYTVVSRTTPGTMTSGSTATVSVTLKNTGNMIWRNIHRKVPSIGSELPLRDVRLMTWDPGYHTSYFWYTTPEWMGTHNQITPSTDIVIPGKEATYSITFRAPSVASKTYFNEQWNLVLDGQLVFPFQGLTFPITVTP